MAFFDMSPEALAEYRPELTEPTDLDDFWARTFADHAGSDVDLRCEPVETYMKLLDVWAISWNGYDDHRVNGWLLLPKGAQGELPAVIQYTGYSMGRGFPFDNTTYALGGWAHFVIDARGQGWASPSLHESTDDTHGRTGGATPGVMTSGILDKHEYYYRRLYVDAVRLVEAAAGHAAVDASRIVVAGGSQGGAMALAAASLAGHVGVTVAGCSAEVPFLCDFPRAIGLTDAYPYKEVADFFAAFPQHRDKAMNTLSYFDCAILARRAQAPALFSVGLMDMITPPSTVYAAYNGYAGGPKAIEVYPFNGHEGGRGHHVQRIVEWLEDLFA